VVLDRYAGSWFIGDSSNTAIVSVMVEEKGRQTADKKGGRKPWTLREFGGKTLWDWLQLLIVPVVLSLITVVFAWQQDIRQDQIESKRANAERELARERAQDEALQAYLSQMGSLLLEKDLRKSAKDSEVRSLARARTLTVLSRLDSARKERLLQFLYEAGLLHKEKPVIDLTGADLSGIDLRNNNLSGGGAFSNNHTGLFAVPLRPSNAANLSGASLSDANLERASLDYTDLSKADLSDAYLSKAELGGADLSSAYLSKADLSNARLAGANLTFAVLKDADLSKAHLTKEAGESPGSDSLPSVLQPLARNVDLTLANLKNADLSDANLSGANLSYANLSNANLSNANLSGANVSNANLSNANLAGAQVSEADLSKADMSGVEGITKEELEKQTSTLEGAIMPDGSVSSDEFEPALSFSLSEEWQIEEAPNWIHIYGPDRGQFLWFTNPRYVFDPSNPSEPKEVPPPENVDEWVSWFQGHPNLETSKPVPASVGGASAKRMDVAVTSTLENHRQEACYGTPCVPLYPLTHGDFGENVIIDPEGYKYWFIIVDVGGEIVVIQAAAPTDKFDEFPPKVQKVLDTVKWQE
jgi:uncharacterized protein YjbI with pentapeptide repeats